LRSKRSRRSDRAERNADFRGRTDFDSGRRGATTSSADNSAANQPTTANHVTAPATLKSFSGSEDLTPVRFRDSLARKIRIHFVMRRQIVIALEALWLPILLSAVIVFIASSVIHMVLPYHRSDYKKLPEEEKVLGALRPLGLAPGMYHFPYCTHKDMKSPETQEKFKQGPVGFLTMYPTGPVNMGKFLGLWFIFCVVVAVFVAYLAGHTVARFAPYRHVFRAVGTAAFLAYGVGTLSNGIWKGHPWSVVLKEMFDG